MARLGLLVAAGLLAFPVGHGYAASGTAPFSAADALAIRTFAGWMRPALSPDGRWLAYVVRDQTRGQVVNDKRFRYFTRSGASSFALNCDIWLTDTRTGKSRNLTGGEGTSWSPAWSPDGTSLAFYSDRSGSAAVWIWDQQGERLRQISRVVPRSSQPLEVPRWTPDSRLIIAKVLPQGMRLDPSSDGGVGMPASVRDAKTAGRATVMIYESRPRSAPIDDVESLGADAYRADLAAIDVSTGQVVDLVREVRPVNYWLSPDGKHLAFLEVAGTLKNSQRERFDLKLHALADHSTRRLVAGIEQELGMAVSWSPDSRSLAYLSRGDCFVVAIKGGRPRRVTSGDHPPFEGKFVAPLWDDKGEHVYLTVAGTMMLTELPDRRSDGIWQASVRDGTTRELARVPNHRVLGLVAASGGGRVWSLDRGRSIVVGTQSESTLESGFWKIEVVSGNTSKLLEESISLSLADEFAISTDVSRDGESVVYLSEDAQHPRDAWAVNAAFSERRLVTRLNPQMKRFSLGASEIIRYESLDGVPLQAAIVLPPGYQAGRRYPTILWLYSGTFLSTQVYRFGLIAEANLQILASHGYVIVVPDAPLHSGRGSPILDLTKTVLPAVNRVVALGIADPDRLGIMGHSFGGYSTLALIEQTDRFKAAVDYAGIGNLLSFYGVMNASGADIGVGWAEEGQGSMGGPPWQFRDRYVENSPLFYLDRVQTPLLLIHGEQDPVPSAQAEEVFVGLRRLGKEAVYAKYAGEAHTLQSPANVLDFWDRVLAWFGDRLTPPP